MAPRRAPALQGSSDRTPDLVLWLALGAVGALGLSRHALWRDELQAWGIVRAPGSLLDNLRYEGHPPLWYVLLKPFAAVSADPHWMQPLHLALALASLALVLFAAPWSRPWRWTVATGYFLLFEYLVVSRSYVLGGLLLLLSCWAVTSTSDTEGRWPTLRPRWWWIPSIALLPLTSLLGCPLAVAAAIGGTYRRRRLDRTSFLAVGSALTMSVVVVLLTRPPADVSGAKQSFAVPNAGRAAAAALVPLASPTRSFWQQPLVLRLPGSVSFVVGIALLVGIAFALGLVLRRPAPARRDLATWSMPDLLDIGPGPATFLVGAGGVTAVLAFAGVSELRHGGSIVLALVAALWLGGIPVVRWGRLAIAALLGLQSVAGVEATVVAASHRWSGSEVVAEAIARVPGDPELVGGPDFAAVAVAIRLDRPLYAVPGDRLIRFNLWDGKRGCATVPRGDDPGCPLPATLWATARSEANRLGAPVVLIAVRPLPDVPPTARLLADAGPTVAPDEGFVAYLVAPG